MSKDKKIEFKTVPKQCVGRLPIQDIMHCKPGPTLYAIARCDSIESSFDLFWLPIQKIVADMTNLEGLRVYEKEWKTVTDIELRGK